MYLPLRVATHRIMAVTMMKYDSFASAGYHSAEEFQALMDAAVDGIVLVDPTGRIQAFNPAAERLFGYPAAEVLGVNVSILMSEPERSAHDGHMIRFLETRVPHII